jgi:molybdate transport system permease protein
VIESAVTRTDIRVQLSGGIVDVDLTLDRHETVAVVGPNAAGKTTLLRSLAGLMHAEGSVLVDGIDLNQLPPHQRGIGYVPQGGSLFPTKSVLDNVAYGLRAHGVARTTARRLALDWLSRLGLADLADERPQHLSGGQTQRVLLTRALAIEPRMLLLDEPLSALDSSVRAEVRTLLRQHLSGFRGLSLIVTHDPVDALLLADRVAVVEGGRVIQLDPPLRVASAPRSPWVARMLGLNAWAGFRRGDEITFDSGFQLTCTSPRRDGRVLAIVEPSAVVVATERPRGSARNTWRGTIAEAARTGGTVRLTVLGPLHVLADITPAAVEDLALVEGSEVWVAVKATQVRVVDINGGLE